MINIKRRKLLKGSLAAGAISIAASAGLLTPRAVLAAWPKSAFGAKNVNDAVSSLLGSSSLTGSSDITIKTPPIAENGAVVNVSINTTLKNVSSISILVEKNDSPLAANFKLSANTLPFVKTRVKVRKTSSIIAVVKAGGTLYSAGREVKVTIGGCGG